MVDETGMSGAERRIETRYKLRSVITAQVTPGGVKGWFAKPFNVMLVNVSPKGVGIHSKIEPPENGSKVQVEILALGHTRGFNGTVRHRTAIQSGYLFGVELDLPKHESLISYLKSCEAEFEIR